MEKKFRLSVSIQKYADKNDIPWNTVNYSQRELTVDELVELVKQGYCFCHCFKSKDQVMRQSEKRDNNFISGQVVFIDIDNSEISLHEFLECLTMKPTIAYTTPNNYTEKSHWLYRFRLCYLLNEPITSISQYADVYDCFTKSISQDIPNFRITDNCGRKASQQFSGNGMQNVETIISGNTYSISDFPFENNNVSSSFYKSETEKPIQRPNTVQIVDNEFMADVNTLNPLDLIDKYKNRYPYFDHTPLHYENGYALIPDDYIEIYRKWYRDPFEKTNGDIIYRSAIKKLKDGERRRYKLFITALARKKMMSSVTYEHLLYNLICERTWFYDNSDSVLTNKVLGDIAKTVMNIPYEEIHLQVKPKKKYVIDKAYCAEHGISPNTMKNIVRKQLNDQEIGNLYDISKSIKENIDYFKSLGIRIGKTKVYDWCKENDINTKGDGLRALHEGRVSLSTCHLIRKLKLFLRHLPTMYTEEKKLIETKIKELMEAA